MTSRLDKLEGLYLNILRVTILVLATVMLVVSVLAVINAAPKLLPSFGSSDARTLVGGASLKDFRDEQQSATPTATGDATTTPAPTDDKIDSRIATAATNLISWGTKNGNNFQLAAVERVLDRNQKGLADTLQGDYADSLVRLSQDVLSSGRAGDDVNVLINWHLQRFTAAQAKAAQADEARAAKTAIERQKALIMAGAAASAFLIFLILLFVFVLVKIERNLRIVMVRSASGEPLAP
jgi:hypothetical protein